MKYVTNEWLSNNMDVLFNGEEKIPYCVIGDKLEVTIGNQNDCNLDYCNRHNIPIYDVKRGCGTIVFCNGTIGVGVITDVKNGWQNYKFSESFSKYLLSKRLNVTIDHNDILVNGYKVASSGELRVRENLDRIYSGYLISYDVDIDAIKHICTKPMVKEPKGLKEFGLSKEELLEWLTNYFEPKK